MGWLALIALLVQTFGPLLEQVLQHWLEHRLNLAALRVPVRESFGSDEEARQALLAQAIQDEPHPLRRSILRMIRDHQE